MNKMILIAAAALGLAAENAHAQLGWTLDDCLAKWGPQITAPHMNLEAGTVAYLFHTEPDLKIQVDFLDVLDVLRVQSIVYSSASRKFLAAHIMEFLQANYAGNWQLYKDGRGKTTIHTWKAGDANGAEAAYAIFQRSNNGDGRYTLQVATGYFDSYINSHGGAPQ